MIPLLALFLLLPAGEAERVAELVSAQDASSTPADAARELFALGSPALPHLLDLVVEREVAGAPLAPEQEQSLVLALSGFGGRALGPHLAALVEDPRDGAKRAVLVLLERVGRGPELALAARAVTPREGDADAALLELYEAAVDAMLRRDPRAYPDLAPLILGGPPPLQTAAVAAIARHPCSEAFVALGGLLGHDSRLDSTLLRAITRIAPSLSRPLDHFGLMEVRRMLDTQPAAVLRDAAQAAGALGAAELVPQLIALLDHTSPGTRSAAHRALASLAGLRFPPDSRRWQFWYRDESRWYDVDAERLFDELESDDVGRAASALRELSLRRLYRDEIALRVEQLLDHGDPRLRALACSALAQLGRLPRPERLVYMLSDPEEPVARAAHAALRSVTGRDLPADALTWSKSLEMGSPQ